MNVNYDLLKRSVDGDREYTVDAETRDDIANVVTREVVDILLEDYDYDVRKDPHTVTEITLMIDILVCLLSRLDKDETNCMPPRVDDPEEAKLLLDYFLENVYI